MKNFVNLLCRIRVSILGFLMLCLLSRCTTTNQEFADLPEKIDYNFHIRPILSDKCFLCHGPDANKREANLRLDIPEAAFAELSESKGKYAIVKGKAHQSEVYHRIHTENIDEQMPPPEANLSLSDREKALIVKWIEQGANYKKHWAFIPPQKSIIPEDKSAEWGKNEIDFFVLKKLKTEGLEPSAIADKETLIRRLSFLLTGLPPSDVEIEHFLDDQSENAYENLVDRLLDSPHYGERMAAYWMDIARYADSDGYLDDKHRNFTPWRDWVIGAFNQNMAYDDFVTQQLAGDLLPNASKNQVLATAFNRLHKKNSEAGIVYEEYRVEYVADRTNTLGKAFMGVSLECARCHDHKYDPISQEDYYKLFGFFNSTFEIGSPVYGPDQTPGPSLMLSTKEEDAQIQFLTKLLKEQEQNQDALSQNLDQDFQTWYETISPSVQLLVNSTDQAIVAHYPFDDIKYTDEKSAYSIDRLNPHQKANMREPVVKPGVSGKAFFTTDYNSGALAKNIGWYERTEPFSIDLWIYPDTIYKEAGVFTHCEDRRLGYKGYSLHLKENRLSFMMAHSWPQNSIQITSQRSLPKKKWAHITLTYDGSSTAEGTKLYIDGNQAIVEIEQDNLYKGILFEPNIHTYGFGGFRFGQRDKIIPFKNGGIDEIKVFERDLTELEVLFLHDQNRAASKLNKASKALKEYYIRLENLNAKQIRDSLKNIRQEINELSNEIPEIMVMGDLPEPRATFVLNRGNYDDLGNEVEPGAPERLLPFVEHFPQNRLGLSQWLFHPQNPLTARVMVNRIWQLHFGKGLVKSSDDFGNQGDLPSHPELLDWLAVKFVETGWDIKALHKLIVMSSTWKQSSVMDSLMLERDPENIFLSRGPRFRLSAEMIRDNALAVSGLLVDKIGGNSVYPYQPEGLWDEITNKKWRYPYLQEPGEGLYRRSLYTIWKRTAPPPSMQIFDLGDRSNCVVKRPLTSTPLQALVLLNDPQYLEAARKIAENILQQYPNDKNVQLMHAYRLLTGRKPDKYELKLLESFYLKELQVFKNNTKKSEQYLSSGELEWDKTLSPVHLASLATVVNSVMNTSEAYTLK